MSKQSAVELLEQQLKERYSLMNSEPLFEQAKQMEKEQHEETWAAAWNESAKSGDFDDYYNKTYGGQE